MGAREGGCVPERGKKRWCGNELVAKCREVPSLISGNTAVSVAAEQERQRQDGCAGLESACASPSQSAGSRSRNSSSASTQQQKGFFATLFFFAFFGF